MATWVALALVGLVIAAAVSLAASRLSSQHIGLSQEPLGSGGRLAPSAPQKGSSHPSTQGSPRVTPPASHGDDSHDGGSHHGGDD